MRSRICPLDPEASMTIVGDISKAAATVAQPWCEHGRVKKTEPALRFRHNSAITVAAFVAMIATVSVGSWQPYLLVLLVIPFAFALWGWRSGTDVDADGLTVRAALGQRRLAWDRISELAPAGRQVVAVLTTGGRVVLTAVAPADLPRLVEATGQDLNSQKVRP
jgi:hypothetical protein